MHAYSATLRSMSMYQRYDLANQSRGMSFEVNVKDDLPSLLRGRIKKQNFNTKHALYD